MNASSIEANKTVVARHFNVINGGDPSDWDNIMAEDFTTHHPFASGVGRDRYRAAFSGYGHVFSDFKTDVHRVIAEDDLVVVHATSHGRHTGDFMGVPATGRPFEFSTISIYRVADGRLAEAWYAEDTLGLLQQLGALPKESGSFRRFWDGSASSEDRTGDQKG